MSTHISYQGKNLGRFKVDENGKTYFVAEDINCLESLLSLNDGDIVDVEGADSMPYDKFKEKWFGDLSGFYVSLNEFLFKNYRGRTAEEVQKELDAKKHTSNQ